MANQIKASFLALALTVLLAACSATEMVDTWADSQFERPVASFLIVGQMEDYILRPKLEERLADALRKRGVQAVPSSSFRFVPKPTGMSPEELQDRARALGFEGVLVIRFVEDRQETLPGYGSARLSEPQVFDKPWYGYFGYGYFGHIPPFYEEATHPVNTYLFETSLYAIDTGLVWWAETSTTTPESVVNKIGELTRELVGQMEKQGML